MKIARMALLLLAALGAGITQAQTTEAPAFATREQYAACLDDAEQLDAMRSNVLRKRDEQQAKLNAHHEEGKSIGDAQAKLDASDEKAVANFNARVKGFNDRGALLNASTEALKQDNEAFRSRTEAYNKRCVGMQMKAADRDAVLKERAEKSKTKAPS